MDAFAVSVTNGLTLKNFNFRHALWMGLYFGGFQFLMPLLGCLLGSTVSHYVMRFGPYISFALLGFIGGKMLIEGIRPGGEADGGMAELSHKSLLASAVATSIDALAVGVGFAFVEVDLPFAVSVIGCVTFLLCAAGVRVGNVFGARYEKRATLVGGIILVLLGVKILLEGLGVL
jgi:putative Mn2+ efflux pump MntP